MRFGLALPHYDYSFPDGRGPVSYTRMREIARLAERLGFDSLWISDHFFLSLDKYGAGNAVYGSLEPIVSLGALAAETERIRLGTLVACAPFRPPAVLAHAARALTSLSGGRFELGLGAGWYEDEFLPFGYTFGRVGERFAALARAAQAARTVAASTPLWIGAKGGPRSLQLVVRYADGWNTAWRWTPEAYAERSRALEEVCDRFGRDPASVRRSVGLYLLIGPDGAGLSAAWERLRAWTPGGALDGDSLEAYAASTLTGTPDRIAEVIGRYAELGVEEIIVNAASMPFAVFAMEQIEALADLVIAAG